MPADPSTRSTESAMYRKVRDFVVSHWKASVPLTRHDSGPEAHGEGISLNFGGIRVEPDIYGIVVWNSTELPLLGEGKLRMGGHEGTRAFAQALTYRNLGMLSFVFFPADEFTKETEPMFRAMCSQAGIGLLRVPGGDAPIVPKRDVVVPLAGGDPAVVVRAVDDTLTEIKGVGQWNLGHIYPISLRDLLHLFRGERMDRDRLSSAFERRWPDFARVFSAHPYDPMVWKKVRTVKPEVRELYFDKLVGGLLALRLIAPTSNGFQLTKPGEHIRRITTRAEVFTSELSAPVRRLMAFAVMSEFENEVLLMLRCLEKAGQPVTTRRYCLAKSCGEYDWRVWGSVKDGRCPSCGGRKFMPDADDLARAEPDGEHAPAYSFMKFARAVGLFEVRPPSGWRAQFPHVPAVTPAGTPVKWGFIWRGEALGG